MTTHAIDYTMLAYVFPIIFGWILGKALAFGYLWWKGEL